MTRLSPSPARSRHRRAHHRFGFVVAAAVFTTSLAFSSVPTPLYALYARRSDLSTMDVTVVFAAYALGVLGSLYLAGHLSDSLGRKPVLIAALLLEVASASLFLTVPDMSGLLVARLLSGAGVGLTTATATAYLLELHAARIRARDEIGRVHVVTALANLCGTGLGPLAAGVLAQYAPAPLRLVHAAFVIVMLALAVLVYLAPETVERRRPLPRWHAQRFWVPVTARASFVAAAGTGFASFAVFGLFTSVSPSVLADLGITSLAVAGLVPCAVFVSGALAQLSVSSRGADGLVIGSRALLPGLLLIATGAWTSHAAVFIVGGLLAGAGAGILFKAAVAAASRAAPPERRAEALAAFFFCGYTGLALPVLGLGLAAEHVPLRDAVVVFAAAVALLVVACVRTVGRTTEVVR